MAMGMELVRSWVETATAREVEWGVPYTVRDL
jgi:hypothetical protein